VTAASPDSPDSPAVPRGPTRARRPTPPAGRLVLLAGAGLSLLAGLDAALILLGLPAPVEPVHLADVHGGVMVLGFLGTLIALERAQALHRSWAYLAPALLAVGSVLLVVGAPPVMGKLVLVTGCVVFVAAYAALLRRGPHATVAVQLLSAVLLGCGALLWIAVSTSALLPWWAAFVILTIAAERAELAQLTMGPAAGRRLLGLSAGLAAALVWSLLQPHWGTRAIGLVVALVAAWLARDDIARRLIRSSGLRRYNSAALLAGYLWLAVAGLTWLIGGVPADQGRYDTVIHAVFLGFGVSMVMAHAPIILPAVLGRPLPYHRSLWAPLALLHAGMALRVAGNAAGAEPLWQTGSVVNILSVLLFLVTAVTLVVIPSRDHSPS
jgi:hypothetical protein